MDFSEQERKFGKLTVGQPAQAQKTSGRGGFLTSLISELGGAGGAAGGAAIGTALLPGIGTLLGAGLGGFLGGTGGRVAENKVRDDRIGLGDALKEGAFNGALSGAGEAFQLAKGAKAAGTGIKDALGAGAKEVGETGSKSMIADVGKNVKANAMGFGQGATLNGEKIGAGASDDVGNILKELNIGAASPEAAQRKLEGRLTNLRSELDGHYEGGRYTLKPNEMNGLADRIMNRVLDHPDIELSKSGEANLLNKVQKLTSANDTSKLWQFTKDLESKGIKFGGSADAKLVDREAVNRIFRDEIRGVLNDKVPGVAQTNDIFHKAMDANQLLKNATTNSKGNLTSRVLQLAPVRGAEAKAGAFAEGAGNFLAGNGGIMSQVGNQAVRQAPGNIGEAVLNTNKQQPDLESALMGQGSGYDDSLYGESDMSGGQLQQGIGQEDLMRAIQTDIQSSGGQNLDTILTLYKALSGGGSDLNSTEANTMTDLQNGIANLQGLSGEFTSSGANVPLVGNLLANIPGNTGAQKIRADVARVKQVIGKALEGGVLRKEDEAKYAQILPTLNDTDDVAQYKIQQIAGDLQRKLQLYQQNVGGGGNSLQDVLMQAQAGSY